MLTAHFDTPFGTMQVSASALGLRRVKWVNEELKEEYIPSELKEIVAQLQAYFRRELETFEVELDWSDTSEFDQKVWTYLRTIPYGKTVSYSTIAVALGDVNLVRAVGGANRRNPIPIIVPCHRVIGKNGHLTGFAYGVDVKARLLGLERPLDFAEQATLF